MPTSLDHHLGFLTFLVSCAFWPIFLDAANTPRWAVLSIGIPLLLLVYRKTTADVAILSLVNIVALLGFSALSLLWARSWLDGANALWLLLVLCCAWLLGAKATTLWPVYQGLGLGINVSALIAFAQIFGYTGIPEANPVAGLFVNSDFLAEIGAVAIVACVASRLFWLLPGPLFATLYHPSRGAIISLGVVGLAWLWKRSRLAALIAAACICAVVVSMSLQSNKQISNSERVAIWQDTVRGMTFGGHGIGSFYAAYPQNAKTYDVMVSRPEYAHNEILHFAFELGLGAIFVYFVFGYAMRGAFVADHYVLLTLLAESLFSFPLHLPLSSFFAFLIAGHLSTQRHGLRRSFYRWAILIRLWVARQRRNRSFALVYGSKALSP